MGLKAVEVQVNRCAGRLLMRSAIFVSNPTLFLNSLVSSLHVAARDSHPQSRLVEAKAMPRAHTGEALHL